MFGAKAKLNAEILGQNIFAANLVGALQDLMHAHCFEREL